MAASVELRPSPAGAAPGWDPPGAAYPRHPRQLAIENAFGGLLRAAEMGVVVVGILLFSTAFATLLPDADADPYSGGDLILRALYSTIYVLVLPSAVVHWREVAVSAWRGKWAVGVAMLALLSVQWSGAPDWTMRRAVALLMTTLFGVYLAGRFEPRMLLKLIACALGIAAVASVVTAVAFPSAGVESEIHVGAWRGVYPQKNNLGQVMVLGTIVFMLLRHSDRWRRVALAGAVLCAALVLLSTSKTALSILLVSGILAVLYRSLRWHFTLFVPFLIAVVLISGSAVLWLLARSEDLLVAMGKDPTLTGRTPMWDVVLDMIARRPLLGYGYSAFWLKTPDSPAAAVRAVLQWNTPHAHNGYLDLALQLGLIGLGFFAVAVLVGFARSIVALRATPSSVGLWPILYISYLLLYNVTESGLAIQNNLYWALFVASVSSPLLYRKGRDSLPAEQPPRSPPHGSHPRRLAASNAAAAGRSLYDALQPAAGGDTDGAR